MRHGWPVKKAIVNLPVRLKGNSTRISGNSLSLLQVQNKLPTCRRLLFALLHTGKGRLRNAVADRVPASRRQGILFRNNCEIISG